MNYKINKQQPIKVAVIGAGLGGLCLAQGLSKNNIDFEIFEKDLSASSRPQGYRIRIDGTGQKALATCLSPELYALFIETCALPSPGVRMLSPQLETVSDQWVDSWNDGKQDLPADLSANRLTMREVLLTGLEKKVHFNKEFVRYEELADGKVRSHFKDGTSCLADIVIAADGIHSKLSALRFSDHELINTGNINIYGKTYCNKARQKRIAEVLKTGTSVIFEHSIALVIDAMHFGDWGYKDDQQNQLNIRLTPIDDYIYWAFIGNRNRFGLDVDDNLALSKDEILQCVNQVTEDWKPSIKALFESVEPSTLAITAVKISLPKAAWKSSCITALGDAIHAMSPAGGLGANTALYDASMLALSLSKVNSGEMGILDAIKEYEDKMRIHSVNSIQASQQGGQKLYGGSDSKGMKHETRKDTSTSSSR